MDIVELMKQESAYWLALAQESYEQGDFEVKTIWEIIQRDMRHLERMKLKSVERIEGVSLSSLYHGSELYISTFECHLNAPFEHVSYTCSFVHRIDESGKVHYCSTVAIAPHETPFEDEEEEDHPSYHGEDEVS